MSSPGQVAVIDIGSNSIKLLVAERDTAGHVVERFARTIDARISAGIADAEPRLSDTGMANGLEAVSTLVADAKQHGAGRVALVATSAVRDAKNGAEFVEQIRQATELSARILSGTEEANLIARGLTCDPALREIQDFYLFDLGGGSLECLRFRGRQVEQAASLQLGCVRLMEKFVADPSRPLTRTPKYRVMQYVHDTLVRAPFQFTFPRHEGIAIATGGTVSTIRAIFAARAGTPFAAADSYLPLTQLRLLLTQVSRMTLEERQQLPGLPTARADVFPTALATMIVVADVAAVNGFRHSLYNLRFGVAAEMLGA